MMIISQGLTNNNSRIFNRVSVKANFHNINNIGDSFSVASIHGARFSGKPVDGFNYKGYADLMTDFSVGGIEKDELALFDRFHLDLPDTALDVYKQLLEKGYNIGVVAMPKAIRGVVKNSSSANAFKQLEANLKKEYDDEVVFNGNTNSANLKALLASTESAKGKSIRLTVHTDDSDKLMEELTKNIVKKGGIPYPISGKNVHIDNLLLKHAKYDEQISFMPPEDKLFERTTKIFQLYNTPSSNIQKQYKDVKFEKTDTYKKRSQLLNKRKKISNTTYMNRMRRIEFQDKPKDGFFRTLGISPAEGLAEEANMPLKDFSIFANDITEMSQPNPVEYIQGIHKAAVHMASQLNKFNKLRLYSDDGRTNLTLSIEGRKVIPSSATGNALPAEIFTSPVEDSANGTYYANVPVIIKGMTFQGITYTYKDGKIIKLDVEKAAPEDIETLKGMVIEGHNPKLWVKDYDVMGEFAIGFNRKITRLLKEYAAKNDIDESTMLAVKNALIAEKQGVHIANGASYTIAGGKNECTLHTDVTTESGPDSGLHVEGWAEGMKEPMAIFDEGYFSDDFLNYDLDENQKVDTKKMQAFLYEADGISN